MDKYSLQAVKENISCPEDNRRENVTVYVITKSIAVTSED